MLPVIRKRSYVPSYADHFFGRDFLSSLFSDGADYTVPAVNIKENDKNFEIEVAAPGLSKEDFQINLEKNILTVSSKNEENKEEKADSFTRKEFSFKSFSRSFSLPESVKVEKISANYKNGVLLIELPKIEEAQLEKVKSIKIS